MRRALFHSFYQDDSLAALKHAALYFEHLTIPDSSFLVAWGDNYEYSRWVQLVPDESREHLEYLRAHGIVELVDNNDGSPPTPQQLLDLVSREVVATHGPRIYHPHDVWPLFQFLKLRPDAPQALEIGNQISLMVGAFCLRATSGQVMPCVDNPIIYDTVLSSLRGFFELSRETGALTADEIVQAKSYFLMARLFNLQLPQIAFRNFEDVLDVRYTLRNELAGLRDAVEQSAAHIPGSPWEPGFASALEEHLERRVLPEVDALHQKARVSLVRAGVAVGAVAISLGLQSLLPARLGDWLIGASSLSLLDAWKRERERAASATSGAPFGALLRIHEVL